MLPNRYNINRDTRVRVSQWHQKNSNGSQLWTLLSLGWKNNNDSSILRKKAMSTRWQMKKAPAKCHRAYWVSKALHNRLKILHILADGSTVLHDELER